jgi:hypothetical protein
MKALLWTLALVWLCSLSAPALAAQTPFAPVLLSPGESVNLAALHELVEKAEGIQPCFLVAFQLVDLDGGVLAETPPRLRAWRSTRSSRAGRDLERANQDPVLSPRRQRPCPKRGTGTSGSFAGVLR